MKHCIALLLIILGGAQARAITFSNDARLTCRQFIDEPARSKIVYLAWVSGFISGRNIYSQGSMPNLGDPRITAELTDYCKLMPETWLVNAAISIAAKLNQEPAQAASMEPGQAGK